MYFFFHVNVDIDSYENYFLSYGSTVIVFGDDFGTLLIIFLQLNWEILEIIYVNLQKDGTQEPFSLREWQRIDSENLL